ncbi:A disintegrin and metalloproteinase with thrombospondin motifs 16 isoform X2 [Hyperolius riggenbachi]|uniref:A disintegrin and metalloproteinase with thrombospondin motifs 16 isoform X2 n=1 Tax=Hyperolius riggenbachi TaxID=752182 RepID=UPI0035A285B5
MEVSLGLWSLLLALVSFENARVFAASWRSVAERNLSSLFLPLHRDLSDFIENSEYDIVLAYEVDRDGNYITDEISHSQRRKRSVDRSPVHLRIHGFGQDMHLELQASDNLIAPGFKIQVFGEGQSKSTDVYSLHDYCFYQGKLLFHENSAVALSMCNGLSGLIRTQETDYLLKPLPAHIALKHNYSTSDSHQPHVLYKRSTERQLYKYKDVSLIERQQELENNYRFYKDNKSHLSQIHMDDRHKTAEKQYYCGRRKKYMIKPPKEDLYILSDEYSYPRRSKRSVIKPPRNKPFNVETLVVVDKKMIQNHGHENITTYVLTILNMVSALFKDSTIGGNINIVIAGLILLEDEQPGLIINHHADHTLSSFCQWQSGLVGKDGSRHDHAILLTGLDICSWKNEPCDTLGFAPISGMCSKYRSCTVNEDTGLGLAFTIAHESGHNFGMIHDGEGNICKKTEGNIMSPILAGHNGVFSWSSCSRQYLHTFLSSSQAVCLVDEPKPGKEYKYPEKLPGELYDGSTQCKWQFGEKAKLCMLDFKKDLCKALWCHRGGRKCETKFMPAAEGTTCGHNMWCRKGQCVKHGDDGPKPINGQWSDWSAWSPCSRTCGGGILYRERQCNKPRPFHGGKFCEGPTKSFKLCNIQKCLKNSVDYRAQQCSEYNSKPFRSRYYTWKPYTQVAVKDGTYCSEQSNNVCIDGVCETVGCDLVLGSSAVYDSCGVCNGDNSTCKIYKNKYTKQHHPNYYYSLVTIPVGARSIRVAEMNISNSYLSVRNTQRKYYLNGYWTVNWPGRYKLAGTVFDYKRPYNKPESLSAPGPTNETITIEILLQGRNPGVTWEFYLPKSEAGKNITQKHNYTWIIIRSKCSASCGGGYMKTKEGCYKDMQIQVNTYFCNAKDRPVTGLVPCNLQACPPSWSVGNWSECSRTCGTGEKFRQIHCKHIRHFKVEIVADKLCHTLAPAQRQACNTQSCPPEWSVGPWSQCSRTCGKGWKKRSVTCKDTNPYVWTQFLPDTACTSEFKPKTQETCNIKRCNKPKKLQWLVTSWSECSTTCGLGVQSRTIHCTDKNVSGKYRNLAPKKCSHIEKPNVELKKICQIAECPRDPVYSMTGKPWGSWYASPWSQCSARCGGGVQVRTVQCLSHGLPSNACPAFQKPSLSQACNTKFCPTEKKDVFCKDFFPWCHLVPQHGVCSHTFYGTQCCNSCSSFNV